jgi:integration host factor subunit alpha
MNCTKLDLINKIYSLGIPRKIAVTAVQIIIDSIRDTLKSGESVKISGFGTFQIKERRARIARNPKTGVSLNLPKRKIVSFKFSEKVINAVK